jgi:hypothetical protein
MNEADVNEKKKITMLKRIESALKDSGITDTESNFDSWIGEDEIDYYIVNDNEKHPVRGFVLEAAAISDSFIHTFSVIAGNRTYGTIMLKSIRSLTASFSKDGSVALSVVTDSGLAFQMQTSKEKWDEIIEFKRKLDKLMENIG